MTLTRADFHFDLPAGQIAQVPAQRRDGSRLLDLSGEAAVDRQFPDLLELAPENAVIVLNDTKVVPARLRAHKPTGGAVELLVLEPMAGTTRCRCLARSSKPLRAGMSLTLDATGEAVAIVSARDEQGTLEVELPREVQSLLSDAGEIPLPPYIGRSDGATHDDLARYQTVYARDPGAVAAPTAGLHFTPELLAALEQGGRTVAYVTLHVGPGTFAPVRVDDLDEHPMHAERYEIPARTAELVSCGRPVVAVGTTVVRALESGGIGGSTQLFIRPGFKFQVVTHLLTNFHLPESTLLMLVSAFAGYERTMAAYRHAVSSGYRFYSYGDAMWVRQC